MQPTEPQAPSVEKTNGRAYVLAIPRNQIGNAISKTSKYSKDARIPVLIRGEYPPGWEFDTPPNQPASIPPESAWEAVCRDLTRRLVIAEEHLALADITCDELARNVIRIRFELIAEGAIGIGLILAWAAITFLK